MIPIVSLVKQLPFILNSCFLSMCPASDWQPPPKVSSRDKHPNNSMCIKNKLVEQLVACDI